MDRHEVNGASNAQAAAGGTPTKAGLLNVDGVAARLGVSTRHVRRLVAERRIPFVKWGHLLRFEPTDVEAWIAEQRTDTLSPRRRVRSGTVR